jgi:hypothetical protein
MAAAEIDKTDKQADQHAEQWPNDVKAAPDSRSIQVGPPPVAIQVGSGKPGLGQT